MYSKKEREYYNITRDKACQRLGITKNQYNWLRRKGEELRKIYEANCNGDYGREAQADNPKIDAETRYGIDCRLKENLIYAYLNDKKLNTKEHKLYVYFQTDPRGATIYLDTKEIEENNYTQAVCIS